MLINISNFLTILQKHILKDKFLKKHLIGHFFLQNHPQEVIPFFADRIFNKITEIYHCLFQAIFLTKS